jgi:hypothetical protein
MKTCSIGGCGRKHLAKELCRMHYLRLYRYGRLHTVVMCGVPVLERIKAKILIDEDGCWIFTGVLTSNGYGHIREGRKMRIAHVVTYEHKHGPVPDGLELDHFKCRKRACCHPDHVEPVTHLENVRRGRAGSNWAAFGRNVAGQFKKMQGA